TQPWSRTGSWLDESGFLARCAVGVGMRATPAESSLALYSGYEVTQCSPRLSEREHVRLGAALEERDLEGLLADRVVLAHELVQTPVPEQSAPILLDVHAVRWARSLSVHEHAEGNRLSCCGGQHEMRVARVEPIGDAPARPLEHNTLTPDRPLAG